MYELGEPIGWGATGVVHRAVDPTTGQPLAVKVLHAHLLEDAKATSRFIQERHALSRVSHPNVVRVIELVADHRQLSIVMELVEGGDLKQLHQRSKPRPAEAVTMAARIADALVALHAAGVVHRDLKPANVLIAYGPDGPVPKITDFGLSRLVEEGMSQSSAAVGTPLYMAPEAIDQASRVGPPADVYALGVILYELLVGVPPFVEGGAMAILKAHHDSTPPLVVGVPLELQSIIRRMLAKDPGARPSAHEIRDRLWDIVGRVDDRSVPRAEPDPGGTDEAATVLAPRSGHTGSAAGPTPALAPARGRRLLEEDEQLTMAAPARQQVSTGSSLVAHRSTVGMGTERRLVLALALVGALVVVAGVLAFVRPWADGERPADDVGYAFDPELVGTGGIATRHWSLSPDGHELTGEVTVFNGGAEPLSLDFVEVFPASLGTSLADVRFEPDAAQLMEADLAAVLRVDALAAETTATFGYVAEIAPGDGSQERLTALAQDQLAARRSFYAKQENAHRDEPQSLDVAQLSITPPDLVLTIGQEQALGLTGLLSDGTAVPAEALAAAAWSTSDAAVAGMDANRVQTRGVGRATVTAQIGDASTTALLTVNRPVEIVAGPQASTTEISPTTTTTGRPETTPPPADAPGTPGQPTAARSSNLSAAALTWAPPPAGGSPVDSYEVRAVGTTATQKASTTALTFTGLAYATSYQFEVRAVSGAGAGSWSQPSTAFLTAEAPGDPHATKPQAGKVTGTSAEISFATETCVTAKYHVSAAVGTGPEWISQGWPDPWKRGTDCWMDHGHPFTGLSPGTTYTVTVELLDTAHAAYATPPMTFTTPPIKTSIVASDVTTTSISVTATSSSCAVMTVVASGGGGTASTGSGCETTFTHTFSGLAPGTAYTFTLTATADGAPIPGATTSAATTFASTFPPTVTAPPTVTGTRFVTTTTSRPTTTR